MKIKRFYIKQDNSILYEWSNKNTRIGLSFEDNFFESGWYFVHKSKKYMYGCGGCIITTILISPIIILYNLIFKKIIME